MGECSGGPQKAAEGERLVSWHQEGWLAWGASVIVWKHLQGWEVQTGLCDPALSSGGVEGTQLLLRLSGRVLTAGREREGVGKGGLGMCA